MTGFIGGNSERSDCMDRSGRGRGVTQCRSGRVAEVTAMNAVKGHKKKHHEKKVN